MQPENLCYRWQTLRDWGSQVNVRASRETLASAASTPIDRGCGATEDLRDHFAEAPQPLRLAEDVIRSLQLTILALKCGQSIRVTTGRTGPRTGVLLDLQEPPPQRLLRAAQLRRNRRNCSPLGWMVRQLLADQKNGPVTNLRTESMCSGFRHDSKFSQGGASCNPGAVH